MRPRRDFFHAESSVDSAVASSSVRLVVKTRNLEVPFTLFTELEGTTGGSDVLQSPTIREEHAYGSLLTVSHILPS